MMPVVSALFVRRDSVYKELNIDAWDIDRNALLFSGGNPVIAHPPCRSWGQLSHLAKPRAGEKELAIWAIEQVRNCGGVLEHPRNSKLWKYMSLPMPGKGCDQWGGVFYLCRSILVGAWCEEKYTVVYSWMYWKRVAADTIKFWRNPIHRFV